MVFAQPTDSTNTSQIENVNQKISDAVAASTNLSNPEANISIAAAKPPTDPHELANLGFPNLTIGNHASPGLTTDNNSTTPTPLSSLQKKMIAFNDPSTGPQEPQTFPEMPTGPLPPPVTGQPRPEPQTYPEMPTGPLPPVTGQPQPGVTGEPPTMPWPPKDPNWPYIPGGPIPPPEYPYYY